MATLEDKLLGEKLEYYCSSSEDEGDGGNDAGNRSSLANAQDTSRAHTSINTGPKGVVEDWQRFKQLQAEEREQSEREMCELAKKLSMITSTAQEEQKRREQDEIDAELSDLMSEEFLQKFQKIRMAEILRQTAGDKKFGKVISLTNADEFLNCLESENPNTTIIVHVFDLSVSACKTMNKCLDTLAVEYDMVKFAKIPWSVTGMSRDFQKNGVPALLVYKGSNLKSSLIRITDELSDDFFASDVESYLIENGAIIDKNIFQ